MKKRLFLFSRLKRVVWKINLLYIFIIWLKLRKLITISIRKFQSKCEFFLTSEYILFLIKNAFLIGLIEIKLIKVKLVGWIWSPVFVRNGSREDHCRLQSTHTCFESLPEHFSPAWKITTIILFSMFYSLLLMGLALFSWLFFTNGISLRTLLNIS